MTSTIQLLVLITAASVAVVILAVTFRIIQPLIPPKSGRTLQCIQVSDRSHLMRPELSKKIFAPGQSITDSGATRKLCRWR